MFITYYIFLLPNKALSLHTQYCLCSALHHHLITSKLPLIGDNKPGYENRQAGNTGTETECSAESPVEILLYRVLWICWLLMSTELITCPPFWSLCLDLRTEVIRRALWGHGAGYKYQLLCICKLLPALFIF